MSRPAAQVEKYFEKLGYELTQDIQWVHGGRHKVLNDTIECWGAYVRETKHPFRELEIRSAFTLTACRSGFRLVQNTQDSDLYGDLIAIPLREYAIKPAKVRAAVEPPLCCEKAVRLASCPQHGNETFIVRNKPCCEHWRKAGYTCPVHDPDYNRRVPVRDWCATDV